MAIPSLLELAVDGSSVAIRFSEALSSTLPSINRFAVLVNGRRIYASSAAATLSNGGTTIRFSLRSAVAPGATVALTYTSVNGADKPGFGDIRSASTNQRAAFFRASTTANLSGTANTVAITSSTAALIAGQTSTITFTFSRDPGASFSNDDISLAGGTLSAITGTGRTRTATFTPTAASSGNASITVAAGSYTDVFGNSGGAGATPALSYNTIRPTITITDNNPNTVNSADGTVTFTFTFTEAVTGFSSINVSVGNGTKGTFSAVSSTVYTLVVTPPASSSGTITVDVSTTGVTDAAGNQATAPAQYTQAFDTLAPTLAITSSPAALTAGQSAIITFSFSQTPAGFSDDDIIISGGNLTGLTLTVDPRVYTATFTADNSGSAAISAAAGSYTDAAGNAGGASFNVAAGTLAIISMGIGDTLAVASGALANAVVAAIGFTATSQTSNDGVAKLTTAGYSVNLANATGTNGYVLTNTGAATTLIGSAFNDSLTGGDGNDSLDGGAGTDTLVGGAGNDTYIVDSTADTITEDSNAGADTIESFVTFSLESIANVENLTLAGTAQRGTGNAGNNRIFGNSFSNILAGGAGTDTLVGGLGNDTYIVDSTADTITESSNAGTDTILSAVTFSLASFSNVENLTLTGTSAINGTGNAGNNTIFGNSFSNILNGGNGNDTLDGFDGIDNLTGGDGVDTFKYTVAGSALISGTTSPSFERITDLAIGTDRMDGANTVAAANVQQLGDLGDSLTSDSITALLTTTNFLANGASTFTFGSGAGLRTFIALNDRTAGYDASTDDIIEITVYTGTLTSLAIV